MTKRTGLGRSKLVAALLAAPLIVTPLAAGAQYDPGTSSATTSEQQTRASVSEQDRQVQEARVIGRLILMENREKIAEVLAKLADQPTYRIVQALRDQGTRATLKQFNVPLAKFAIAIEPHWSGVVRDAQEQGKLSDFQAQLLLQELAQGYGQNPDDARPRIGPVRTLSRLEARSMTNQALAEISGKTPQEVQMLVGELGINKAGSALGVNPDALAQAVQAKMKSRIETAVSEGRIAAGQATVLLNALPAQPVAESG